MTKIILKYYLSSALLVVLISLNFSCREKPAKVAAQNDIESKGVYLLAGEWEMIMSEKEAGSSYREKWILVNDNRLKGEAYVLNKNQDKEFRKAQLSIYKEDEQWKYFLNMGQQKGVVLSATIVEPNLIRFEQTGPNYPQYIQYNWEAKNKIFVEMGNKSKTQSYELKRKMFR